VKRNVVKRYDVPDGQAGRPSKSLTLDQAVALLEAAEDGSLYAYVTVSLMVGARTEELRALPTRCVEALRRHRDRQGEPRAQAGAG
jgi:hypothetical protein